MSLHRKIVLLFTGVTVLPLLVFALVVRHQSLAAAERGAEVTLTARAEAASQALADERRAAQAALDALARGVAGSDLDTARIDAILATGVGPPPEGFVRLALAGVADVEDREAVDVPGECRRGRFVVPIRLRAPLPRGDGALVAEYLPGGGIRTDPFERLWVEDAGGSVLLAVPCDAVGDRPPAVLPDDLQAGALALDSPDEVEGVFAFARVGPSGWAIVAEGQNILRAPLASIFRTYGLFVLALGATALLAFSFFLGRVTGSLGELTVAAERVAGGDLRPWLPTPRDDEVGQLTEAFAAMTDRLREMVEQVDRTGRLAILGQLSAYLAHEIRNPLSAVKMNLQRLRRWERAGEISSRCAGAIEVSLREVDRLSSAVSNILQLTPGEPREKEIVAVHDLVSEAARLLDSEFTTRGVGLRWELNARLDRVLGDPGQLKGVIINLMLNALEAQPDGGRLLILSSLRAGTDDRPGPVLDLRFRDSGPGIPHDVAERVFDPFFTTKASGSGIGLAVARQAIRDHGGQIFVAERQRADEGAEVVVRLPLAAVEPEERSQTTRPKVPAWGGGDPFAG